jgi:hypothetical protein
VSVPESVRVFRVVRGSPHPASGHLLPIRCGEGIILWTFSRRRCLRTATGGQHWADFRYALTRSRPLTRPCGLRFHRIPFAISQMAQVSVAEARRAIKFASRPFPNRVEKFLGIRLRPTSVFVRTCRLKATATCPRRGCPDARQSAAAWCNEKLSGC